MASYNSLKNLQNGKTSELSTLFPPYPPSPNPTPNTPTHTHTHLQIYQYALFNHFHESINFLQDGTEVRRICTEFDIHFSYFKPEVFFLGKFSPTNQDCFLTMVCDVSKTK